MSLLIVPLVAVLLSLFVRKKIWPLEAVAVSAAVIEFLLVLNIMAKVLAYGSFSFGSYFYVNSLGALVLLIVSLVGLAASVYSVGYLREEVAKNIIGFNRVKQYFLLLHLFLLAMLFAVTTENPIMMWIAVEATTLSTAFLISFYNKPSAMEAAWKYLMINSIGLLLAFFGTLLFLTAVKGPAADFINWRTLIANAANLNPIIAKMAFVFVLIGYGTKVGFAPMHTWLPDAHSKAPAPISSLLSGVLLNVAFLAILRFKIITDSAVGANFAGDLLIGFGLASITLAAFIIFIQRNYKRLLAYSSIEHMGIIALGIGFGGVGAFGALLHMVYHAITKSILFHSAGNIFLKYGSTKIAKVRGVLSSLPITGVFFIMGFLAIVGVPPFGIFISEFYIVSAGIAIHPVITGIMLLLLILVFAGLLKKVSDMVFGQAEVEIKPGESSLWTVLPPVTMVIILIVLSFYLPGPLKSLIDSSVSTL